MSVTKGAGPGGAFGQWVATGPTRSPVLVPKLWYESSEDPRRCHEASSLRGRDGSMVTMTSSSTPRISRNRGKKAIPFVGTVQPYMTSKILQSAEYAGEHLEDPVGDFLNQAGNDYSDEELNKTMATSAAQSLARVKVLKIP